MLKHIVMWKLKDENKDQNIKILKEKFEDLKTNLDVIKELEIGKNIEKSNNAFDVVLYSVFENEKDLEVYQNHSLHKKVGEFLKEIVLERKVVDYVT